MHTIEIYESISNYAIKSITRFCFPLQLYYEPAAFTAYDNYIYINNIIKSQKNIPLYSTRHQSYLEPSVAPTKYSCYPD